MLTFKKYYLKYLIILSIVFFLQNFTTGYLNPFSKYFLVGQTIAVFLTIILGTLSLFWDTKWGPNKRKKLLLKSPFTDFKNLGFIEVNNEIIGFYNNYQVKLLYKWTGLNEMPCIEVNIFYNPKRDNNFISIDEQLEIYKILGIFYTYAIDCITKSWSFNFIPTKFETIKKFLDKTTKVLKERNLSPITIEESEKLLPEFKIFIDEELNNKRKKLS